MSTFSSYGAFLVGARHSYPTRTLGAVNFVAPRDILSRGLLTLGGC